MVFRGWYDFGGGSMADMGHYSLWTVFNALELSGPTSVEPGIWISITHDRASRDVAPGGQSALRISRERSLGSRALSGAQDARLSAR